MYTIKTMNAISPVGLAKLPTTQFEIDNETAAPDGILVRSADLHEMPLPDSLLAIARAFVAAPQFLFWTRLPQMLILERKKPYKAPCRRLWKTTPA